MLDSEETTQVAVTDAAEPAPQEKRRVGIACQGGVIPAGAFAAGVLKGLVEKKAYDRYDMCAFSGTSAGALVATVCWGHKLKDTIKDLKDDLEKQWKYLAWPRHLALLPVWTPEWGAIWTEVDAFGMKFPMWRYFVERLRTPFFRWIMKRWIEDVIPIDEFNAEFRNRYASGNWKDRPGLVLGSADVLRGEIKTFREDELSLSALLASGSIDEINGTTTIVTPPHAGTYLDGAWGDNPPIGELLDYRLDEIWFIQCFPKAISELPHTPAERKERKDELWQNSLVEHELEFVKFVNYWHGDLNKAIEAKITKLQDEGKLPQPSPTDPDKLIEHLQRLYDQKGKLPQDLLRLFDESNNFAPKKYKEVKVKTIRMGLPRELGSAIVNAPWFIRNMMDHGYERALDFAERDFGNKPEKPGGLRPGRWAWIPSPVNNFLYGVHPSKPVTDALELVCDFCPRKAASTAGELLLGVLPKSVSGPLVKVDQAICAMCPKTFASQTLALAA